MGIFLKWVIAIYFSGVFTALLVYAVMAYIGGREFFRKNYDTLFALFFFSVLWPIIVSLIVLSPIILSANWARGKIDDRNRL